MKAPQNFWSMTYQMIHHILPDVHALLRGWIEEAGHIPDQELRRQALASIRTKTFHCEGGALFALLAEARNRDALRFIVAYQTISDYLDNLCDRSTSLDPVDFRALHESMRHALTPGATPTNYYRFRQEQDDGGYLQHLVTTCQASLAQLPAYPMIAPALHELVGYYSDLQVYKHIAVDARVPALKAWFEEHRPNLPKMEWQEFSACTGSTLGIFCLVSYAYGRSGLLADDLVCGVRNAYFPWVQGLHILMDYFVDQEEDREGGDLNFCFYYDSDEQMLARLTLFLTNANESIAGLPQASFHRMICMGLPAFYLAERKVAKQPKVKKMAAELMRQGGLLTRFFYWHCLVYRRLKLLH